MPGRCLGGGTAVKNSRSGHSGSSESRGKAYDFEQPCDMDLRKLKGHGLVDRVKGKYRLPAECHRQQVAILFLLFHKMAERSAGPGVGSCVGRLEAHRPRVSNLEAAYYQADRAIDNVNGGVKRGLRMFELELN